MIEFAATKKIGTSLGLPQQIAGAAAMEVTGGQSGSASGEGAALHATLQLINAIPGGGPWAPALKTLGTMGVFGGVAAAKGEDAQTILIQTFIPAVLKSPRLLKYWKGRLNAAKTTAQQKAVILDLAAAKMELAVGRPSLNALSAQKGVPPNRGRRADASVIAGRAGGGAKPAADLNPPISGVIPTPVTGETIIADLVKQIKGTFKSQRAARDEMAQKQSKVRGQRSVEYHRAYEQLRAEGKSVSEANKIASRRLSGPLLPEQEIPKELRPTLSPDQWEVLRRMASDRYRGPHQVFDKKNSLAALEKIRLGKVLQDNEIDLIYEAYGRELALAARGPQSIFGMAANVTAEAIAAHRALLVGADISFNFRQNIGLLWNDVGTLATGGGFKPRWAKAFGKGLGSFMSKGAFERWTVAMEADPWFQRAKNAGVQFMSTSPFAQGEQSAIDPSRPVAVEGHASRFVSRLPFFAGGDRAAAMIQNVGRLELFKSFVGDLERKGVRVTAKTQRKFANQIADLTGRSNMGKSKGVRAVAVIANRALFSPGLFTSRVRNLSTLFGTFNTDPHIIKQGIRTTVGMAVTTASAVVAAKLAGADVEADPRSADFGKVKIGNTRFDMFGGHGQFFRLGWRFAQAQTKAGDGHIKDVGRKEVIEDFVKAKLAPSINLFRTVWTGRDFFGKPIVGLAGTAEAVYRNAVVLWLQETADAYIDAANDPNIEGSGPFRGLMRGAMAWGAEWTGVSVQTYPETKRTEMVKIQDIMAREKHGKNWEDTSIRQQIIMNAENHELLEWRQHLVDVENAAMDQQMISLKKLRANGEVVEGQLSPANKKLLSDLAINLTISPRGPGFIFNKQRLGEFQETFADLIDEHMPKIVKSSTWKKLTDAQKRSVVETTLSKLKRHAQKLIAKKSIIEEVFVPAEGFELIDD
jgi:hypothetical protein